MMWWVSVLYMTSFVILTIRDVRHVRRTARYDAALREIARIGVHTSCRETAKKALETR